MRDLHKANRIIARLEEHPDFSKLKTVVIIGRQRDYPYRIKTTVKDINVSAFGAFWSKLNLLKEVSGYDFRDPTDYEYNIAEEYCREYPKWPDSTSVTVKGEIGIVCF